MFLTKIQSHGLPRPDGSVGNAQTLFEFSFCLAEENDNKWLMGVDFIREDRCTYWPVSQEQGVWIDAQEDLMRESGLELSWFFHNAAAAFEFVERLGACRIGPSLQDRYVAGGGDIIAPPLKVAEEMHAAALDALEKNLHAQAFDRATRLLAAEGFRPRARQIREQVLSRFACFDAARRERDILALLGEQPTPQHALTFGSVTPPIGDGYRAVAVELQGLPLQYPALENHLTRYLYRIDVPMDIHAPHLPWLVRMPEVPYGLSGEHLPEMPEQETWLTRTGASHIEGIWQVQGEAAQEALIAAFDNGLATTTRWGLLRDVKLAQSTAAT
ncbi:hypothetical protein BH11PSE11_BH11PSE11_19210 [soil metagenome]